MKPSTNIQTPAKVETDYLTSDYLSIDGKLYAAAYVREAVAGYITPSPSPVPTGGLEMAARRVVDANAEFRKALPLGWEGDLLDDACKELDRALKGNSPAPAIEDGVVERAVEVMMNAVREYHGLDPMNVADASPRYLESWRLHALALQKANLLQSTTPPAVSPGQVPDGWQPIESAPKKDGKHLLLFGSGHNFSQCVFVGFWRGEGSWHTFDYKEAAPTHWRPLPAPPQGSEM